MSDLSVDATQRTRSAAGTRTGRAAALEVADLTATFDQVFATIAQATRQATPQSAPSPVAPIASPAHVASLADVVEPVAEEYAVAEERLDAEASAFAEKPAVAADSQRIADSPKHFASSNVPISPEPAVRSVADRPQRRTESAAGESVDATLRPAKTLAHDSGHQRRSMTRGAATTARAETAASAKAGELQTSHAKLDRKLRGDRPRNATDAATSAKSEAAAASQREDLRPVANVAAARTEPALVVPHTKGIASGATSQPAKARTADTALRHGEPIENRPTQRAAKERPERPAAPAPAISTSEAPATATSARPEAPTASATSASQPNAKRAGEATNREVAEKTTENLLEKASGRQRESADTPNRVTEPERPVVSELHRSRAVSDAVEAKPTTSTPAPKRATQVDPAIVAAAPAETPVSERRRPRESRATSVSAIEAKSAPSPTAVAPKGTESIVPATAVNASMPPASAVVMPTAPMVIVPAAAEPLAQDLEVAPLDRSRPAAASSAAALPEARDRARVVTEETKGAAPKRPATDTQPEVDRVRLVQRVAKALQTAQERGGSLRLRLTPPELGVLKIELVVRDGALSARLEAETPAAKAAILENLPSLRERLTAQEIKIERFDVDLMQQSDHSGGERQSFADAESSREQAVLHRSWRNERQSQKQQESQPKPAAVQRSTNGGLNVLA